MSSARFLVVPNKRIEQEFRMIKWKPTTITILSIVTIILLASCGSLNSFPSDIQNAVQTSIPTLPPVVATGYPVPNVPTSTVAGDRPSSAPVPTSTITENQSGSTLVPTIDSSLASFLPRPDMTPGEADPRVTQADIHQTICTSGYTKTVRPPESVTEPMKRQSILDYGLADRKLGDYEYDHLIPLEIGGAPQDTKNLWPEPVTGKWNSYIKDKLENKLNQLVCDNQLDLTTAQQAIASDWIAAYLKYVGTP
jgi:hypothetical protein